MTKASQSTRRAAAPGSGKPHHIVDPNFHRRPGGTGHSFRQYEIVSDHDGPLTHLSWIRPDAVTYGEDYPAGTDTLPKGTEEHSPARTATPHRSRRT